MEKNSKQCNTLYGCGLTLPLTIFPDTYNEVYGSKLCIYCLELQYDNCMIKYSETANAEEKQSLKNTAVKLHKAITYKAAKRCSRKYGCGLVKPLTMFMDGKTRNNGMICSDCLLKDVNSSLHAEAKQQIIEGTLSYGLSSEVLKPETKWEERLKYSYNLSLTEYLKILENQDYACGICTLPYNETVFKGRASNLVIDTDMSGNIRGLLCSQCKNMVESFNYSEGLFLKAKSYMKKEHLPLLYKHDDACEVCKQVETEGQMIELSKVFKTWNKTLKRYHNITVFDYLHILYSQVNCCGICGRKETECSYSGKTPSLIEGINCIRSLIVDVEKSTGQVRGLLCRECNWGVKHAENNSELLSDSLTYLKKT